MPSLVQWARPGEAFRLIAVDTFIESDCYRFVLHPSTAMDSHGTLRRVRKRRRRTRKLSDNRELWVSVMLMVVFGILTMGLLTYLMSTRACQAPRFLQNR